jgi:hypothetical protein
LGAAAIGASASKSCPQLDIFQCAKSIQQVERLKDITTMTGPKTVALVLGKPRQVSSGNLDTPGIRK